jgi:hypothetical protein
MACTIKLYEALKRMRTLTDLGIPFTFTFLSYNATTGASDGFKEVANAQLRKSYRDDQSKKADLLIGYVNQHDRSRWFYLPLLIKFNELTIKP